jgi:protein N-lysine methyltransferase METTL21D
MDTTGIPDGPLSLPKDATFVSDADEEIFLLYTRLAALKPPDSSDTGHFHGLGSENSKDDALLVRIELKPPPPTTVNASEPGQAPKLDNRNTGRRNRGKKRREGFQSRLEPVVLEYRLFQNITALRTRSGDTGSVVWKTRL